MKKSVLFLLLATLLCGLCFTGFAEEADSYEKLLGYVPYAAYTGQAETIETQGVNQCILRIFYKELEQKGLIPTDMKSIDRAPAKEDLSSFPQVSVEDVCKTFDRLFGPNASRLLKIDEAESGKPILDSMSEQLYLSEDKKTFYYVPCSYGGGDYTLPYGRLFRSEVVGEDLCLYVRMVYTSFDNDLYFWLFETFKREKALIDYRCDDWGKLGVNPWEMLDNGELDEYLPVYKHTFKPNGDGTYYWAQTELDTAGKEIPESVLEPSVPDDAAAEELLKQVPSYAHTGEKESILTVSREDIINQSTNSIFFYGLQRDGLIPENVTPFNSPPTKEQLAECPKVSAEDVEKTLVRLFGPEAITRLGGQDSYSTRGHLVLIRLEDGSYAYYDYSFGGGDGPGAWTNYIRSETVGEDLVLYTKFAYGTPVGYNTCWLSESVSDGGKMLLSIPKVALEKSAANPLKMLKTGAFDEYLPTYRHTFKPNGDGTYYWAQTELDTAGKEIPLSLIEEEEQYLQTLVESVPEEAYRGSVTNPNYQSHSKLTSSMLGENNVLFVSESYAEWVLDGTSLVLYSPRGNEIDADRQIVLGTWENVSPDKNQASIEGLIRDEKFVQYYTEYRHTFKENEDGTYSWVETIVNRYGEKMPVALTGGSSNTNTDFTTNTTDTVTDVTTDTVTDGTGSEIITDSAVGVTSDVGGAEESTSYTWVYITVGAVVIAAAAAVAVFFEWKKKKA